MEARDVMDRVLIACVAVFAASAAAEEFAEIELIPDKPASWHAGRVFAPLTGLFRGGLGYWYDPRVIEIETTPSGAYVDLFYVRGSFQRAYEQTESPVKVILPPRIETDERDSVTIRVMANGFGQKDAHVLVRSRIEKLVIDLEPLPNQLISLNHFYLAGRGSLSFLTKEALTFRNQKADDGFSVVLTETAGSVESYESIRAVRSPVISSLNGQQLGEDLVVRVALTDRARAYDVRSRQSYDPIRRLHSFSLDFVPPDGGAADIERTQQALARVGPGAVTGCARAFDDSLRGALDPQALSRALVPQDRFMDRYTRATIKRLGEVSPNGLISALDGSKFSASIPIELSAAASQAGSAIGYLALLRAFVTELEPAPFHRSALKGWIAPEMTPSGFDTVFERAEADERSCTGPG